MLKNLAKTLSGKYQTLHFEYKTEFKPRWSNTKGHPRLKEVISQSDAAYKIQLENTLLKSELILSIPKSSENKSIDSPFWNNGFFPGLDVIMLLHFISEFKPKKYIEVGSGNSTKIVNFTKKQFNLETQIISIDPFPRAEIDHLADKIHRVKFEDMNSFDEVLSLDSGDILFIDNSHRVLPNSDCTVFFLEILPFLKPGVIVHIHDIYLPFDYPQFMCDRAYNEQYMLAAYLLAKPSKYEILMPNFYISEHHELSQILAPIWNHDKMHDVERHGGSFWFKVL